MRIKRKEREKAERLSRYVDRLLGIRPSLAGVLDEDSDLQDRELTELREIARALSRIKIQGPAALEQELGRRLAFLGEAEPTTKASRAAEWLASSIYRRPGWNGLRWLQRAPVSLRTVLAGVLLSTVAGLALLAVFSGPRVSAAEILNQSDSVLAKLVRPGEILYRRWNVVYVRTAPDGSRSRQEQVIHEWMDGANRERTAGRSYSTDGRLLWAYTSVIDGDDCRPYIFLGNGYEGDLEAVLNIEPTSHELTEAAEQFPPNVRRSLETYLTRGYIYHPIIGDHQFNRVALQASASSEGSRIPRTVLSLDTSLIHGGVRAYRVRIFEPLQVRLTWRTRKARIAHVETVRYISQDSYLSLRAEEQVAFEDGLQQSMTWDMAETRVERPSVEDRDVPFEINVPPDATVRRHSAIEVLRAYADALSRVETLSTE